MHILTVIYPVPACVTLLLLLLLANARQLLLELQRLRLRLFLDKLSKYVCQMRFTYNVLFAEQFCVLV